MNLEVFDGITIVNTEDFYDLERTLFCGQAFRWKRVDENTYMGVYRCKPLLVMQEFPGGPVYLTATPEEVENLWNSYFGFSEDLQLKLDNLTLTSFEQQCIEKSKGIHILKQDLWEMIISYIISQRNTINNIGLAVDRISKLRGKPVHIGPFTAYTFPDPYTLYSSTDQEWKSFKLGYRESYVRNVSGFFAHNPNYLQLLNDMSDSDAYNFLCSFPGIGPKVANCILLFGMHRMKLFPIDVWIQRVIDRHYNGYLDTSRYGDLAGLIQQYMFNFIRN